MYYVLDVDPQGVWNELSHAERCLDEHLAMAEEHRHTGFPNFPACHRQFA